MEQIQSLKQLIFSRIEAIAQELHYDFVADEEYTLIGQIVDRDDAGSITETPLSFECMIDEEKGKGKIVFYQSEGEIKRQEFEISRPDTIVSLLTFIQETLKSRKDA